MGLRGAPSYFQHHIGSTVLGRLKNACDAYLDDIVVAGKDESEFIANLRATFMRLREKRITLNVDKCKLGLEQVEYVGHTIDSEGLTFSPEKLNKVKDFVLPTKQSKLKSFLGLTNYFRDHVRLYCQYDALLQPMVNPYKKHKPLTWSPEALKAYKALKHAVVENNKLYFMEEGLPLVLETDACDNNGIGAYIYIRSRMVNIDQSNSSVRYSIMFKNVGQLMRRKHMLSFIPLWN
jgi:hypothetical protein